MCRKTLFATVHECLPALRSVSLTLDVYGDQTQALKLRSIIDQLQSASSASPMADSLCFIVQGTFKVTRQQVANTLWHAFTGEIAWFKITETVPPRTLTFRSIEQTDLGIVDYPLNEGGAVRIATTTPKIRVFELRLDGIAKGLEVLACYYPRHFADLLNENADSITADALLQCCVFGELIYS